MSEYHLILEEVLTPELRKQVLEELEKRGWIHRNVMLKRKKDDTYFISIVCTAELLGKVSSFLLDKFGWLIIEKMPDKTIKRKECIEYQQLSPF